MSWVEIEHGGRRRRLAVWRGPDGLWIGWPGRAKRFAPGAGAERPGAEAARDVRAPMTGRLVKVVVAPGAAVAEGELLAVLEAMKMEYRLVSPRAGVVRAVHGREGERVDLGRVIVEFEA
jgi:biotin carboxyl carrier protein